VGLREPLHERRKMRALLSTEDKSHLALQIRNKVSLNRKMHIVSEVTTRRGVNRTREGIGLVKRVDW